MISGAKLGCFSPGRFKRNPRFQTIAQGNRAKLDHLSDKIMSLNAELMGLGEDNKQKN